MVQERRQKRAGRPLLPRGDEPVLGQSLLERELLCCVCWVRTHDATPCGHTLCEPCFRSLKNRDCPICRRHLPLPGPVDYALLARDAPTEDLAGLQQAYRTACDGSSPKAAQARASIAVAIAERIKASSFSALTASYWVLPLEEQKVLTAVSEHLKDAELNAVGNMLTFAAEVEAWRSSSLELKLIADQRLREAAQQVLPALSLAAIDEGISELSQLNDLPAMDKAVMSLHLEEALLRNLQEEFDGIIARQFAGVSKALVLQRLLDESQECYLASMFAARLSCLLSCATLQELHWVEENVLPELPGDAAWTQAEAAVQRQLGRRVELLEKTKRLEKQFFPTDIKDSGESSSRSNIRHQPHRPDIGSEGRVMRMMQTMQEMDQATCLETRMLLPGQLAMEADPPSSSTTAVQQVSTRGRAKTPARQEIPLLMRKAGSRSRPK
mmetsp:Transcript_86973/g.153767  ORF Transcript_86973/g.153767 Transcript_86973/m.153767 type:complete len:441 (+) Transcript_86973:52-1374(+)